MGSNAKTDVAAAARRLRERVPGSSLLQTSNFSFLQLPNSKTNQPVKMAVSKIRQNYREDCEALINKQINMEFYASYVYLSMKSHFSMLFTPQEISTELLLQPRRPSPAWFRGSLQEGVERGARPRHEVD